MEIGQRIKVALVRGNSLNEWEGKAWESLGTEFEVTGICAFKNLYDVSRLTYPLFRLPCSTDSFSVNHFRKYLFGQFQKMSGLEEKLRDFQIAHTAEVYYFYTNQAVRAKKLNPKLKVACTVWDNSFSRFEHNYWPFFKTTPTFWSKKIRNIIKENVEGVDLFLPVTRYSQELLLNYGVPESKIKILSPALIPLTVISNDVIGELGLAGKELYLMINRMVKEKGIADVLIAWRDYLAATTGANKILLAIGDGPERNKMINLAEDLGLQERVRFIKNLANHKVRELYQHAKCLVLGSLVSPVWQEQFGYVLAEAISNDCPVISTYSGAIPEVVEDAGLLYPPGHSLELKKALLSLDNLEVYQGLKNSCQRVKVKFAIENFRQKLAEIYQSLLFL